MIQWVRALDAGNVLFMIQRVDSNMIRLNLRYIYSPLIKSDLNKNISVCANVCARHNCQWSTSHRLYN